MALNSRPEHVVGVHDNESRLNERFAQDRSMAVAERKLPLGLWFGVRRHVSTPRNDHLPEHVPLDECALAEPLRQRVTDGALARCLRTDDEHRTRRLTVVSHKFRLAGEAAPRK